MPRYAILDTFSDFAAVWDDLHDRPIQAQVELWMRRFGSRWPELRRMYTTSHAEDGEDWTEVLQTRVFPQLPTLLPAMRNASAVLPCIVQDVCRKAERLRLLEFDVQVIVMGPCGYAGWGTVYGGRRACLLGLDTIADLGWTEPHTLFGLVAHELGHLVHIEWRQRAGLNDGEGPFWRLYQEGFAQHCEHLIAGATSWHMQATTGGWLEWCDDHLPFLAREFLAAVANDDPTRRFFGSLPDNVIDGYRQTGYYLGCEVIRRLYDHLSVREAALLASHDVNELVIQVLTELKRD
ncbi:MAG: hypothetical protein HZB26_00575 [Candidatus Hydrogenedentes bacterium]|nr:hypothetical protein [Candidatus Hydrogenedentota bacterium]